MQGLAKWAAWAIVLSACSAPPSPSGPADASAEPATSAEPAASSEPAQADDPLTGSDPHPLEVTGKSGDLEYRPVMALATAAFVKDGRVHLVLELADQERKCESNRKPKAGDRQLTLSVPWQTGAKLDAAMPPPDESFNPNKMKRWDGSRWEPVSDWKAPVGSVEVWEAPEKTGEKGRVRVRWRVGRMKLRGDLPVLLCVDAK